MNNMVEKESIADEKPEYGAYIGYSILVAFGALGALGLFLIVLGFYFVFFTNLVLWMAGTILVILFLWPAIGLSFSSVVEQDTVRPLLRSYDASEFDNPKSLTVDVGQVDMQSRLPNRCLKERFLQELTFTTQNQ